ncbi:unnamed protein product [Rotaria socialis]|uniref:ADP ribosyltransferase domain-containing protein n=2 Tax=Rotaria socialis TaxID=392032 RepID=A0A817Z8S3_9BILA|nr:unnamed protein product [Rotaria socialis]CAF4442523.1 unnamed protein product [Rotaria socialis]
MGCTKSHIDTGSRMQSNRSGNQNGSANEEPQDEHKKETENSLKKARPNITVLWLDYALRNNDSYQAAQEALQKKIWKLVVFISSEECIEYMTKNKDERFILIVSKNFGEKVISVIHDLPQLTECYILSMGPMGSKEWTFKYTKIKEIIIDLDGLAMKLKERVVVDELIEGMSEAWNDTIVMQIYNKVLSENIDIEQQRNAKNSKFMYFLLLIEILLKIVPQESKVIEEFTQHCEELYKSNTEELKNINDFKVQYKSNDAISWYTRESFYYRSLNAAIRSEDYDLIYAHRQIIIDLYLQLKIEHEQFHSTYTGKPILLSYRGQAISLTEFVLMRESINQLISIQQYLSTSLIENVAIHFAKSAKLNDDTMPILFQFKIDTRLRKTTPYAPISQLSDFANEYEVLISAGSIFKVEGVTFDEKLGMGFAKLALCDQDEFELKDIMNRVKEDVGDDFIGLGYLFNLQHDFSKAKKCFEKFLSETTIDEFYKSQCHRGLGFIEASSGNYDEALKHYHNALDLIVKSKPDDRSSIGAAHICLAEAYAWKNDNEAALKHLEEAKQHLDEDTLEMANLCSIKGNILKSEKNLEQAIDMYRIVLRIRLNLLPINHPALSNAYNNIGVMYYEAGNLELALEALKKALEIKNKTLSPNHQSIMETEENIVRTEKAIQRQIQRRDKILEVLSATMDTQKTLFPSNVKLIEELKETIVHIQKGDYSEVQQHEVVVKLLKDVIDIRRKTLPDNDGSIKELENIIADIQGNVVTFNIDDDDDDD